MPTNSNRIYFKITYGHMNIVKIELKFVHTEYVDLQICRTQNQHIPRSLPIMCMLPSHLDIILESKSSDGDTLT